ncbi:aspartyl-phosphate phosphatase Spo0E family protein [Radiobacillus kanasensis]|uniref:aspartyl-phosphate phosphatase Spo0E family protein n=1 Tax=Radiobacillus kanasensis TaxID=2844358 RepID=UPI001E2C3F72|nr:aspartyl-phosphate phosphatase Spo0E family protein [Radiobacillus kanasensis]UFT99544.1 aspartyl-phosphate phosphatase Spo0E family protein [Radiobacillus kanasensis]
MDYKLHLLEKIEKCRQEMICLTQSQDLTSEPVVTVSTRLDYLINEYQKQVSG